MHKQPRSVQVVVFSEQFGCREYLLLRRVSSHGGFWQSVTGSLEGEETHQQAAIRELREETGFQLTPDELVDLDLTNRFEIAPEWRSKYAPGVTHNEERCFAAEVEGRQVELDPSEHDAYLWVAYEAALDLLYWESTRRAFAAVRDQPSRRVQVRECRNR